MASASAFPIRTLQCLVTLVLALGALPAHGKGGLGASKRSVKGGLRATVDSKEFERDIQDAIGAAMGCGGAVSEERLGEIQRTLQPMWSSMPKNDRGRVERRSLRYLAHRYFMQTSSLMVRGFEPSRPVNSAKWGSEDILSQKVPAYVESVLESKHADQKGFGLQDAVHMIAMLDQLIFDSETHLLEKIYKARSLSIDKSFGEDNIKGVFEDYIIHWMLGDDAPTIRVLLNNRTLRETAFPHWHQLVHFMHGQVNALQYKRQRSPSTVTPGKNKGLSSRFSFDDAHEVVGSITKSFSSFWESECQSMKMTLVGMDTHNTGRVPLSKFYGSALDTEWRFGESEQYLRELGALDESSAWRGKQVIIPNYIQAASNCIVSTAHYLVCCVNDCENILGEIESAVGSPVAEPGDLLRLVGNMTAQTTLDDDASPQLEGALAKQLQEIAAAHGGQVPLHGRLFAQWLHYVFPRDCPFPHKMGKAITSTPLEYGEKYIATNAEMKEHADRVSDDAVAPSAVEKEELQWMSQWSSEEELVSDHAAHLRAPWEGKRIAAGGFLLLIVVGALAGVIGSGKKSVDDGLLPMSMSSKSHFV